MPKVTCYRSANKIIGPCGPCTFINLIGLKGDPKLEKKLQKIGRIKPFYASDFTSFLVWAEKYKLNVKVFVEKLKLKEGTFKMMFKYENIPKEKQQQKRKECIKRREDIIRKNKGKIFLLKKDPLKQIDELLTKGYSVAFTLGFHEKGKNFIVGHMRVAYKKEKSIYFIKDSEHGLLKLSEKEMKQDLKNLKVIGSNYEIIALKTKIP